MPHVHGRFAPTPSGPLHAGSLVAAVASYLDARHQAGRWSLRIEDVDPPRCPAGAADTILRQLEAFGLEWDGEVRYQSQRAHAYETALARLTQQGMAYRCSCSRRQWRDYGIYPGWCRQGTRRPDIACAWRLRSDLGARLSAGRTVFRAISASTPQRWAMWCSSARMACGPTSSRW